MSLGDVIDGIPAVRDHEQVTRAAAILEQAMQRGLATSEVRYQLAMCYKHLGRTADACKLLTAIQPRDANTSLQLGILAFREQDYQQAEQYFAQAATQAPQNHAAQYNRFLCLLFQGKLAECCRLLPRLIHAAQSHEEKRFLQILDALISTAEIDDDGPIPVPGEQDEDIPSAWLAEPEPILRSMTSGEEAAVLQVLHTIPDPAAAYPLLDRLARARSNSPEVQKACLELVLVQAKRFADRFQWRQADQLLAPLSRLIENSDTALPRRRVAAFWNLQGCCAALLQDYRRAIRCFAAAIRWRDRDPGLRQNLALAYEWQGRFDEAEIQWEGYFDLLLEGEHLGTATPPLELAYQGMLRVADVAIARERWHSAIRFLQRARQLRPHNVEILERLFTVFRQLHRLHDCRLILEEMARAAPDDPARVEMFRLDLYDVRTLGDLEHLLDSVKTVLAKYPDDDRLYQRATTLIHNCAPFLQNRCDQLSQHLNQIVEQIKNHPRYRINWTAVHDEIHYVRHEFQKLRRLSNRCAALADAEDVRRIFQRINEQIDRQIEVCMSISN